MAHKYLQDTQHTLQYLSISLTIEEHLLFLNYMKWFGQVAYYLHFNLPSINRLFIEHSSVASIAYGIIQYRASDKNHEFDLTNLIRKSDQLMYQHKQSLKEASSLQK